MACTLRVSAMVSPHCARLLFIYDSDLVSGGFSFHGGWGWHCCGDGAETLAKALWALLCDAWDDLEGTDKCTGYLLRFSSSAVQLRVDEMFDRCAALLAFCKLAGRSLGSVMIGTVDKAPCSARGSCVLLGAVCTHSRDDGAWALGVKAALAPQFEAAGFRFTAGDDSVTAASCEGRLTLCTWNASMRNRAVQVVVGGLLELVSGFDARWQSKCVAPTPLSRRTHRHSVAGVFFAGAHEQDSLRPRGGKARVGRSETPFRCAAPPSRADHTHTHAHTRPPSLAF